MDELQEVDQTEPDFVNDVMIVQSDEGGQVIADDEILLSDSDEETATQSHDQASGATGAPSVGEPEAAEPMATDEHSGEVLEVESG